MSVSVVLFEIHTERNNHKINKKWEKSGWNSWWNWLIDVSGLIYTIHSLYLASLSDTLSNTITILAQYSNAWTELSSTNIINMERKNTVREKDQVPTSILKMKTWLPGCMSKMSRRCDGIIYPTYTNTPFKIKTFRINHPESLFWVTGKQIPNKYTL